MANHFHVFTLDHRANGDPYTRYFVVRDPENARREVALEMSRQGHTTTVEPCNDPGCLGRDQGLRCRGHRAGICRVGAPA
jgi:hypothetical protein